MFFFLQVKNIKYIEVDPLPVSKQYFLFKNSEILISGANFGCGSSREHAVWAILDYGIKWVIAESFADIFYNNCFKNGLLAITLPKDSIQELFRLCREEENIHIDLINQVILDSNESEIVKFEIESFQKTGVLEGLDEIGLSLKYIKSIKNYEDNKKALTPWIFRWIIKKEYLFFPEMV